MNAARQPKAVEHRLVERLPAGSFWYRLTWDGRTIATGSDCDALCKRARDLGPGATVEGIAHPEHPERPASTVWYSPR